MTGGLRGFGQGAAIAWDWRWPKVDRVKFVVTVVGLGARGGPRPDLVIF